MAEKTEITNLPEGMSSDELDALTTGEEPEGTELAQEALDATDGSSPAEESVETEETAETETEKKEPEAEEPEVDPKDAVIGDFRRKLRDEELKTAKLEGEIEARKSMQTTSTAPEKSPLEIAEDAYKEENGDLEGFTMSGELYRQQRAFDKAADIKTTAADSQKTVNTAAMQAEEDLQEGDLSAQKMGQGLDLRSIAPVGEKHLTRGDRVDISDIAQSRGSKAALKEAYKLMVQRTIAAGGADAKIIKDAINAKGKVKSQPKPKKEPTDIDALTTEGEDAETGEAGTETHSKALTDFVFSED